MRGCRPKFMVFERFSQGKKEMNEVIERVLVKNSLTLYEAIVGVTRVPKNWRTGSARVDSDFSAYDLHEHETRLISLTLLGGGALIIVRHDEYILAWFLCMADTMPGPDELTMGIGEKAEL